MTAPLLAVALCLLAAGPASAADGGDELVVSVDQSDSLGLVKTAQSDGGTDADSGPDRRLVGRESGERVDAVVIALWTIAGVMTVLLGVFLWHTSPRRRLRLAGPSAELFDGAEGSVGPSEDASTEDVAAGDVASGDVAAEDAASGDVAAEDESREDSLEGGVGGRVREALLWLRSRVAPQQVSVPAVDEVSVSAVDDSQQESGGDSEDESAVWKFGEEDGGERSV